MNNAAPLLVLSLLRFAPVTLQSIDENEDAFYEVVNHLVSIMVWKYMYLLPCYQKG